MDGVNVEIFAETLIATKDHSNREYQSDSEANVDHNPSKRYRTAEGAFNKNE